MVRELRDRFIQLIDKRAQLVIGLQLPLESRRLVALKETEDVKRRLFFEFLVHAGTCPRALRVTRAARDECELSLCLAVCPVSRQSAFASDRRRRRARSPRVGVIKLYESRTNTFPFTLRASTLSARSIRGGSRPRHPRLVVTASRAGPAAASIAAGRSPCAVKSSPPT